MIPPGVRGLVLAVALVSGGAHAASPVPPGPPGALQHPGLPAPVPPAPADAQHGGDLDCRGCHQGKHRGVVEMYLGMGGRHTPPIPSHMLQVRVECIACHVMPKEEAARAGLVGQTFRPSERACVGCHGEKYRGMLGRWSDTLARMEAVVTPKLEAARAALLAAGPRSPKQARARQLVGDAEHNLRFETLGKGVHNVFYAADLLKLSNGWLDEALGLLGKAPAGPDDALVRGGYCAVLCHEQAGVRVKPTVTFAKQRLPHGRHVFEFGATCTACHSAEVHKAVTATAATCSSCHHSPQNDRCERCHQAQAAFYRGRVQTDLAPVEPNPMADGVPCTGCHDLSVKHSRPAIGRKCVECHEPPYLALHDEWTSGFDKDAARASAALKRAEAALAAGRRTGRAPADAGRLVQEGRTALGLVLKARGAHNPGLADTLLEAARRKGEEALAEAARR